LYFSFKAQSSSVKTFFGANGIFSFPAQPFLKVVFKRQIFLNDCPAQNSQIGKAADRNFSGALVNQNFPYSTKILTRCFFRQAGQIALRFSRSRFSFFARRVDPQNRP